MPDIDIKPAPVRMPSVPPVKLQTTIRPPPARKLFSVDAQLVPMLCIVPRELFSCSGISSTFLPTMAAARPE